jgi:hypothetical protein
VGEVRQVRTGQQRLVGPAGFTRSFLRQGGARREPVSLPLTRRAAPGGAPRVQWLADAVRKSALEWLCREDGWRRRQVVAGGQRRQGRVWAEGIFEHLDLRFTPASLHLLTACMEAPTGLPEVSQALAEAVREELARPDPATGDLLALHVLVSRALPWSGPPNPDRPLARVAPPVNPGLSSELENLRGAVRSCISLSVLHADGYVPATTDPSPRLQAVLQPAIAWLTAGDPGLGAGAWQRLGGDHPLLVTRLDEVPAYLACELKPRTRSTNLGAATIKAGLARLPHTLLHPDVAANTEEVSARLTEGVRHRALLRLSPLTQLFRPQEAGLLGGVLTSPEGVAARLAPLFRGDRSLIMAYKDHRLAEAWIHEERRRQRAPAAAAWPAYDSAARALAGYLLAAREAKRQDALRPLVRFYARFLVRFGTRVPVLTAYREQARSFDRASEREGFLAAVAGIFEPARSLQRAVDQAMSEAFMDRSEEEKVLLADHHEVFREVAPEVEAIRRDLAGEIG